MLEVNKDSIKQSINTMIADEIPAPHTSNLIPLNRRIARYRLNVLQHPVRVRCCGFGEKDRRPLDPPPIVELIAEDINGVQVHLEPIDTILLVAHCELFSQDKQTNQTLVYAPWTIQALKEPGTSTKKPEHIRNLIGATISHIYHLNNEENTPGTFFIFNDLSVRTEGTFTLKFTFVNLIDSQDNAGNQSSMESTVHEEVFTQPFSVYSAKKFPGLTKSTSLSRCFSKQGIKIPIRDDAFRRNTRITTNTNTTAVSSSDTTTNHSSTTISASSDIIIVEAAAVAVTTMAGIETSEHENTTASQCERTSRYTRLPISDFLLPEE